MISQYFTDGMMPRQPAPVLSTVLAESIRSLLHQACHLRHSRRQVLTNREEPLQALGYGHCGKKFAAKSVGDVEQVSALASDDSVTLV
jgi:hypothetical protein